MSIEKIEICRNGVICTLHNFKKFYCDKEDLDIVRSYNWQSKDNNAKSYCIQSINPSKKFHQAVIEKYSSVKPEIIHHFNRVEFDNRKSNLLSGSKVSTQLGRKSRGYTYRMQYNRFEVRIKSKNQVFDEFYLNEMDALTVRRGIEKERYGNLAYIPIEDFSDNIQLLEQVIRGSISIQEAQLQILREVAKNTWLIIRYDLFDLCNQYGVSYKDVALDKEGFIVDRVTQKRLCPYI